MYHEHVVLVELSAMPGLDALLGLMFDEAFSEQSGRQAALDRLCEVLMIRLLRHCMDHGLTQGGTLAGLANASSTEPVNRYLLYIVLAIAVKTLSNFTNHAFATPVDERFSGYKVA